MQESTDIIIIGGGVIGCAIAYYLRKSHVEVTIVEQGEIGGQASSAAAGLLAPLGPLSGPGPFADLLLAGFALFPALVTELEAASGLHLGYQCTGALRTVRQPKRVAHLKKRWEAWKPLGLEMHWLSGEEACHIEPVLSADICAAVYVPEESQIQAAQVVKAFSTAATQSGAKIYPHKEIVALETDDHTRVTAVRTLQGETLACRTVIIACGAWTARCCHVWLNVALPINPLHGQLLSLQPTSSSLQHIIFGDGSYLAPRGNSVLVGATKEERGFHLAVTDEGTSWLYNTATQLVPSFSASTKEAAWSGLRPKTPDSRPILGYLPHWKNVIVAAGHNSVGIMLSAITGQMIAELVTTGRMPAIIRPFSADWFV